MGKRTLVAAVIGLTLLAGCRQPDTTYLDEQITQARAHIAEKQQDHQEATLISLLDERDGTSSTFSHHLGYGTLPGTKKEAEYGVLRRHLPDKTEDFIFNRPGTVFLGYASTVMDSFLINYDQTTHGGSIRATEKMQIYSDYGVQLEQITDVLHLTPPVQPKRIVMEQQFTYTTRLLIEEQGATAQVFYAPIPGFDRVAHLATPNGVVPFLLERQTFTKTKNGWRTHEQVYRNSDNIVTLKEGFIPATR